MRTTGLIAAMCLSLTVSAAFSQDASELIDTYRRNFARSSLGTKYELLKEASSYPGLGPLYDTAIQFVLNNASLLSSDVLLRDITILSVNMIRRDKYAAASVNLWSLFKVFKENTVRVPILQTLADVAKGNASIVNELNQFLDTQVALYRSSVQLDLAVLDAALSAVGKLGDPSSFPYLFAVYVANMNKAITDRAAASLAILGGDYAAFLAEVIRKNPPVEKASALEAGLRGDALAAEKRAELAEVALTVGVSFQSPSPTDQAALVSLRVLAARELTARKWQRASPLAIKHFYDFQVQYNRGQVSKSNFLESIALLGAMGTQESAQALSLYLQLINTETEQGKSFDEQVTLAVVHNLGLLGDKSAFDYLLYVGYLQYPESVKSAARDALQKLNW